MNIVNIKPDLNALEKPTDYSNLYLPAQQGFEEKFRGLPLYDLLVELISRLPEGTLGSFFKGEPAADFNPGTPTSPVIYKARAGVTYQYFLDQNGQPITIPTKVGEQWVSSPYLIWQDTYWKTDWTLVDKPDLSSEYVPVSQKNAPNGVAALDENAELPDYAKKVDIDVDVTGGEEKIANAQRFKEVRDTFEAQLIYDTAIDGYITGVIINPNDPEFKWEVSPNSCIISPLPDSGFINITGRDNFPNTLRNVWLTDNGHVAGEIPAFLGGTFESASFVGNGIFEIPEGAKFLYCFTQNTTYQLAIYSNKLSLKVTGLSSSVQASLAEANQVSGKFSEQTIDQVIFRGDQNETLPIYINGATAEHLWTDGNRCAILAIEGIQNIRIAGREGMTHDRRVVWLTSDSHTVGDTPSFLGGSWGSSMYIGDGVYAVPEIATHVYIYCQNATIASNLRVYISIPVGLRLNEDGLPAAWKSTVDTSITDLEERVTELEDNSNQATFSGLSQNNTGELIFPKRLFMIDGRELPIYKENIIREIDAMACDVVLAQLANGTGNGRFWPKFTPINNIAYFTGAELKETNNTKRIFKRKWADPTHDYYIDFDVSSVSETYKTGQTAIYNPIGDSLWRNNAPGFAILYLSQINSGITVQPVGTYTTASNGAATAISGETKGSWSAKSWCGRCNLVAGQTVVPQTSAAGTQTTNPFLRLATPSDYAAHPDWCFRSTGALTELSYAEDTNKNGNFYIFDYAYYLQQWGLPTPNIITIGLGGNDISVGGAEGITYALEGYSIMVNQIRSALPDVPIGLFCSPGRGTNSPYWSLHCDLINQMYKLIDDEGWTGVDIVGAWASISRYTYPYSETTLLQNDGNPTISATKGDATHFTYQGLIEYGKVIASWILNRL